MAYETAPLADAAAAWQEWRRMEAAGHTWPDFIRTPAFAVWAGAEPITPRDKVAGCQCCRHWAPFVQCSQVDCLACPDCAGWRERAYHRHLERLCAVYGRFCERTGLPQWSADELAAHLLLQPNPDPAHVAWLRRFDAAWERHEARS